MENLEKKNYRENGKISTNKIYFIFDFTYDVQFLSDLDNKLKYCGFPSKRKLHRKQQKTDIILHFVLQSCSSHHYALFIICILVKIT